MSENETPENTSENTAEGQQSGPTQPPFSIQIQYLKDFSFESPGAPLIFANGALEPSLEIQIDVTVQQLQEQDFEVCIHLNADSKQDDQKAYLIEMVYGGVVRVANVPQEMLQPLLFVEIPRLLFPYVRQILTNTINEGGFPQVALAPFDFMGLFRQRVEIAKAEAEKAAADAESPSES